MSRNATNAGAEATVSNWDGHFVVENSASALSCTPFFQRARLSTQSYNGYSSTAKVRKWRHTDTDTNSDEDASISSTGTPKYERRSADTGRQDNGTSISLNRSIISSTGGGGISQIATARLGSSSRQTTLGSSFLGDSMTEIIIEDLQNEHEPTSALLGYCKRKFLRPYMRILSLVGLNPICTDTTLCRACLSYLQVALILIMLLFGYFIQYLTLFRGDRGFSKNEKYLPTAIISIATDTREEVARTIGELLFGYVIPNTLHLMGFISAVIVCKIVDNEQLQNLIERVFLMSMKPRHLCMVLWMYIFLGFVFLCLLFAYVVPSVLMQSQVVQFKWLAEPLKNWDWATKIVLLCIIFIQDFVEIMILTSYCIECYLLRVHLTTLSHKLLMHSIESLDWMREVLEFRKLLDHLNQRVAIPVCFFIVMNLSYALAGFIYLFNDFDFHYSAIKVVILNIINVLLWLVMGLLPFFMAASVTRVCQRAQANGHQIRVRPFVYHNTSSEDLNSTLLFASTLDMSAKLFRMPIQPSYLCFAISVISVVILTLGMCLNLSVLGTF